MRLLLILISFLIFSCQEKQTVEENKIQKSYKTNALISSDSLGKIFKKDINSAKQLLKEKGCINFSTRQYGNTDEWYLECDLGNSDGIIVMFNGTTKEPIQFEYVFNKPVKDFKNIVGLEELKKSNFKVELEKDFDNKNLFSRIVIKPPDFEKRYIRMIEGE